MISQSGSTASSQCSLAYMMSHVLEQPSSEAGIHPKFYQLMQKADRFEVMLAKIAVASANLGLKAVALSHKVRDIGDIGRGREEEQGKEKYSLQLASDFPRRVARYKPFSLTFRIIDRRGCEIEPDPNETFILKVLEEEGRFSGPPGKHPRDAFPQVLVGETVVNPSRQGEITFTNLVFNRASNISPNGKFTLEVGCPDNSAIKSLEVDPITVKYTLKNTVEKHKSHGHRIKIRLNH